MNLGRRFYESYLSDPRRDELVMVAVGYILGSPEKILVANQGEILEMNESEWAKLRFTAYQGVDRYGQEVVGEEE